jgi:hypothetical protein
MGGHTETWGGVTINIDNDCARKVMPQLHGAEDMTCTVE